MHFPLTLPRDKPFDAVGFGLNAVDHLIVVPEYPAFDTKMRLLDHKQYISKYGEDMPEISAWKWGQRDAAGRKARKR